MFVSSARSSLWYYTRICAFHLDASRAAHMNRVSPLWNWDWAGWRKRASLYSNDISYVVTNYKKGHIDKKGVLKYNGRWALAGIYAFRCTWGGHILNSDSFSSAGLFLTSTWKYILTLVIPQQSKTCLPSDLWPTRFIDILISPLGRLWPWNDNLPNEAIVLFHFILFPTW